METSTRGSPRSSGRKSHWVADVYMSPRLALVDLAAVKEGVILGVHGFHRLLRVGEVVETSDVKERISTIDHGQVRQPDH